MSLVVFAQMERETIATRVRDNMIGLAKKDFGLVETLPMVMYAKISLSMEKSTLRSNQIRMV